MSVPAAAALDEAKAYLRIADTSEDAAIARLIGVATAYGERFTGAAFLARDVVQTVPACASWLRLAQAPVVAITGVRGLPADGASFALPVAAYAIDIDAGGEGWVRIVTPGAAGRAEVTYRAGLAETIADLPEPLVQGVIRLTAHLFTHRDAADEGAPPAAVAALWRPWRRLRLGRAMPARGWR